jgi:hypothetical protein
MVLLLGLWAFIHLRLFRRPEFHSEGATTFQAPRCVGHRYRAKLGSMSQSRLKPLVALGSGLRPVAAG